MCLNETYSQAISQILLMTHLSIVNQTCAMIVSDENHKALTTHVGILGASPVVFGINYELAVYSRNGTGVKIRSLKKNYTTHSKFCK